MRKSESAEEDEAQAEEPPIIKFEEEFIFGAVEPMEKDSRQEDLIESFQTIDPEALPCDGVGTFENNGSELTFSVM